MRLSPKSLTVFFTLIPVLLMLRMWLDIAFLFSQSLSQPRALRCPTRVGQHFLAAQRARKKKRHSAANASERLQSLPLRSATHSLKRLYRSDSFRRGQVWKSLPKARASKAPARRRQSLPCHMRRGYLQLFHPRRYPPCPFR